MTFCGFIEKRTFGFSCNLRICYLPRWVKRFLATVSRFWNFLFNLSAVGHGHHFTVCSYVRATCIFLYKYNPQSKIFAHWVESALFKKDQENHNEKLQKLAKICTKTLAKNLLQEVSLCRNLLHMKYFLYYLNFRNQTFSRGFLHFCFNDSVRVYTWQCTHD